MKKLLLLGAVALMGACTTDYSKCPQGGVYYEHNWHMELDYNRDGWFEQTCQNCGLQRMYNSEVTCSTHYGAVYLYKSPDTGRYTDYRLSYQDESGNHLETVRTKDLTGPVK